MQHLWEATVSDVSESQHQHGALSEFMSEKERRHSHLESPSTYSLLQDAQFVHYNICIGGIHWDADENSEN